MAFKTKTAPHYFWQPWIWACRPKTLTIAPIPILVGTVLAQTFGTPIKWSLTAWALVCAIWIQMAANLINDALDFKKGADTNERVGPQRMTQAGFLTPVQVLAGGIVCMGLALLSGIPLILEAGQPCLYLILISILCSYIYTGGPYPLAYAGLGEIFVFVFFGLGATAGVFYIQTGYIDARSLLAGSEMGLLASVVIAINNFRDTLQDAQIGKNTLAVRFGKRFARLEIAFLALFPFLLNLFWMGERLTLAAALPFLALPVAIRVLLGIWRYEPGPILNQFFLQSVLLHMLFGCLLSLGLWVA